MNQTINDRMEILISEYFDGNKAAFAKSIGLPPTGMSNYLGKKRRSKPSVDMIAKIVSNLNINARWLLIGEEENVQIRNAGRDYVEKGKIEHQGTENYGTQASCATDLEKENAELKRKLISAQEKIIELMSR